MKGNFSNVLRLYGMKNRVLIFILSIKIIFQFVFIYKRYFSFAPGNVNNDFVSGIAVLFKTSAKPSDLFNVT